MECTKNRPRLLRWLIPGIGALILLLLMAKPAWYAIQDLTFYWTDRTETELAVKAYAEEMGISIGRYPKSLIALLERNPETKDFVLGYPFREKRAPDLSAYQNSDTVPLFLQWDPMWGYEKYGSDVIGITGCGPTCLAMVCTYLLNDATYTPAYVADFALENGYYVPNNGSSWTLISEGGKKLGIDVVEIGMDEDRIIRNLQVGNPIICVVGPGIFTDTGHFIVLTGYHDGKYSINDPFSPEKSAKLWELKEIKSQIRNLWVCRNIPTE